MKISIRALLSIVIVSASVHFAKAGEKSTKTGSAADGNLDGYGPTKPVTLSPNPAAQKIWDNARAKKAADLAAEAKNAEAKKTEAAKEQLSNRAMLGDTEEQLNDKFPDHIGRVDATGIYYGTNFDVVVNFSGDKAAAITWHKGHSLRAMDPFRSPMPSEDTSSVDTNLTPREIVAILKDNQGTHGAFTDWKEDGTNRVSAKTADGEILAFRTGSSEVILIIKSFLLELKKNETPEEEPADQSGDQAVPFKVTWIQAKVIEQESGFCTVSWKATVRNNTTTSERHRVTVRFMDKDGFVLEESTVYDALLKPGKTQVTEKVMMKTALWKATESFNGSIR